MMGKSYSSISYFGFTEFSTVYLFDAHAFEIAYSSRPLIISSENVLLSARNIIALFQKFNSEVIKTITGYTLPVITLDKSTPREAVCKVFENVNTGGVPLTVFELVTATFAVDSFDLRKDWKRCRRIIQGIDDTLRTDLLDGIDETTFLTAVTLYTSYIDKQAGKVNAVSCKKKDVLALSYKSYLDNRDQVILGFQLARDFLLKYQFVFRMRDLPYTTQMIPLAAIFRGNVWRR